MFFDILTIFPEAFESPLRVSILKRAIASGAVHVACHNIRDVAEGPHRAVDDTPYGGGAGMVMKPDVLARAIEAVPERGKRLKILMSAQGKPLTQKRVIELSAFDQLLIVCGHYEGVDERILPHIDAEISVGDVVVTGGEIPSLMVMEAVARLVPGVLGNPASITDESFSEGLLEYPQYTRPVEFRGVEVPEVLRSGHHVEIEKWRRRERLQRTLERRPELLKTATLNSEDRDYLAQLGWKEE